MFEFARQYSHVLLPGALLTLQITVATIPLFTALGLVLAVAKLWGPALLRRLVGGYVELIRGTPLLVQVFYVFYVLPLAGPTLDPAVAGVVALTLNFGAYASEIFRGAILAIPRGQLEAAAVLGFGPRLTLQKVIIPQAVPLLLPQLGNSVIELFKATSLLQLIAVTEIVARAAQVVSLTRNATAVWILVAAFYFALCFPTSLLVARLERRVQRLRHGL
jgi:His/Glu/Gln/Arg/opine family amino acid ABC transporter permease subunit